ncbi:hypothetical protein [Rhodococcus erythropolis]|uniref:hypothetical protein n=1 Tax=Rhodococcus erythropolis TaxID=1833 RepID=UPI001F2A9675|nr:hypothetical protein [Rhodococcus erythropolis]
MREWQNPRMTTTQRITLTPGRVWEITTEHGTRHLVDLRYPDEGVRRMRIPGPGRPEHSLDGQWQGRVGTVHHREMAETGDWDRGHEIVIGEPCILLGPSFSDWHRTAPVIAVRTLREDEVPPLGRVAYEPPQ